MTITHSEGFTSITPGNATAGNYDISCAQNNAAQAVVVLLAQNGAATDLVTSVTYGGVPLVRQRFDTEATEPGAIYIYWGISNTAWPGPVTYTCRVARTGTTNIGAYVACAKTTDPVNFTLAYETSATGTSASVANPSWTMTTTAAVPVTCYEMIHSGLTTMTGTGATGWSVLDFVDLGAQGRGVATRDWTGGALACGWTAATADDFVGSSIAFREIAMPTSGGARQPYVNRRAVSRAANW